MGPGNFGAPLTFFQPAVDPAFLATHHQAWKSEGGILAMAYQQQPLAGQSAGWCPFKIAASSFSPGSEAFPGQLLFAQGNGLVRLV